MWDLPSFYTCILNNCDELKMQLMNNVFNNIENKWFNSCANVYNSKYAKKFTNPFKYKCGALSCYMCSNIY
jgi:hypothetical protein